ncbi:unnamed protein product [Vitrella brassicaformis CCMP3155]|uniref:Uncharacterized protein n=2 Tax=Vitrella brassicaformis TaxID=1169539 RepID=A0A0G4GL10_VITBC|nr:unnamed protein product [Vitrella brassicaformis CCMP3155]|mmetsp:Transcript_18955/g.54349  ORF Transcript_18955/g.54349 Transcript_18955/m.54349 type:complete len:354 (-) Transcript_18955:254-1315(-)|eukprot:CEM30683.1 unnamed protein product [Vitrella brassicaformis CCMP3155]
MLPVAAAAELLTFTGPPLRLQHSLSRRHSHRLPAHAHLFAAASDEPIGPPVCIVDTDTSGKQSAREISERCGIPLATADQSECSFLLEYRSSDGHLTLRRRGDSVRSALSVDYVGGRLGRRLVGVSRGQGPREMVAKAVTSAKVKAPCVWDMTAGLGRDAAVLAAAGCTVRMLERHPGLAALLEDGVQRLHRHTDANTRPAADSQGIFLDGTPSAALVPGPGFSKRLLGCHCMDSSGLIKPGDLQRDVPSWMTDERPDVCYLDPMFPPRTKSAEVRKDLRLLQDLLGHSDTDADHEMLFRTALRLCRWRVVVKRPASGPPLLGVQPSMSVRGRDTINRFDVYLKDEFATWADG